MCKIPGEDLDTGKVEKQRQPWRSSKIVRLRFSMQIIQRRASLQKWLLHVTLLWTIPKRRRGRCQSKCQSKSRQSNAGCATAKALVLLLRRSAMRRSLMDLGKQTWNSPVVVLRPLQNEYPCRSRRKRPSARLTSPTWIPR